VGYGVNREWEPLNGRARPAAKRKKRASRRASSSASSASARRAKKKGKKKRTTTKRRSSTTRSRTKRAPKKRAAPKRKPAAKKARLYTRYDPETGQKVRVTAETFEYAEWPSRKPTKKKIARAAFRADPLGTTGTVVQTATKRAIEKQAERTATRIFRQVATSGAVTGTLAAGSAYGKKAAIAALPIAGTAAIAGVGLSLAIALGEALRNQARVRTGDAINKLSLQFVANQKALMRATRAPSWDQVPKQARDQLIRDYKSAVATAAAQGGFTRSVEGYK